MIILNRCPRSGRVRPFGAWAPGMTLLELSVVILVMLSMVVVLFIGGRAWKRGSDRALCIATMETVQKGVRGYSNLYGYSPGDTVAGFESRVIGLGRFIEKVPTCPGGGNYTMLGDSIPPVGTFYISCSLAVGEQHEPSNPSEW